MQILSLSSGMIGTNTYYVYDEDTKGTIFDLLTKIEESVESGKQSKDEKLLDKFTWYLNAKKKRN